MNPESRHPSNLPPSTRECLCALRAIDFELAYLALLTREGFKPLSRWEKPLGGHGLEMIGRMGLMTRQVRRTVETGAHVVETIFAATPAWLLIYEQHFAGRPIDKSAATVRLEGFLFGYPPCCIERYVKQPYAPNDVPDESRRFLFHWPCPQCRLTPLLLPACQRLYTVIERIEDAPRS